MKKEKAIKRAAEKKIRKAEKVIRTLPVSPQVFTYVKLYQVMQELHFQGNYKWVLRLCDIVLEEDIT